MKKILSICLALFLVLNTLPINVITINSHSKFDGTIDAFNRDSLAVTDLRDKPEPFEVDGSFEFAENLAKLRPVTASSEYGDWTAEKAVDEDINRDSRWQSGEDVAEFKPVWLAVDLGNDTEITAINIQFDMKMYGNFIIQTSDDLDAEEWNDLLVISDVPQSKEDHYFYEKEFDEPLLTKQYVRLYFTNANSNAYNKSIGIQNLELMGYNLEFVTGNIILDKAVKASNEYGNYKAKYSNDGKSNIDQERWQSGEDVTEFTEQWIEYDLTSPSIIYELNVLFGRKLYGNFDIQTSPTNGEDAVWETIYEADVALNDVANPPLMKWEFDELHTERFVRLYFKDVNPHAANKAISIFELEMIGSHYVSNRPTEPNTADQAIQLVTEVRVTEDGRQVILPKVSDKFELKIKGSDQKNIVSNDGSISNYSFDSVEVDLLLELVNKQDKKDKAEVGVIVTVPSVKDYYPEIFPVVDNPNPAPNVIPTLQEWHGYNGVFTINEDTRIVINDKANLGLEIAANNFKEDVADFTGYSLEVETGVASSTDIELIALQEDLYDLGEEGNVLIANDNGIKIYTSGYNGGYYGLITILQVMYQQRDTGIYSFPLGVTRDYPQFEIRGAMVDIARIPYRMDYLEDLAKVFSFYKMNEFHVHLNDDMPENVGNWQLGKNGFGSFRLESDTFPSLGVTDRSNEFFDNVQYSKEEYIDFQSYANRFGLNVVSEIDAPGHSLSFNTYVEEFPEEAAKQGITGPTRNTRDAQLLALSGPHYENAAKLIRLVFDEYLGITDGIYNEADSVFKGNTVHIGADEYWQIGQIPVEEDTIQRENYAKYVIDMHEKVKSTGKTTRVWSHIGSYLDKLPDLDTEALNDMVLDVWHLGYENIQKRIDQGYKFINFDEAYVYGNTGRDRRDIVNVEYLYENWTPYTMNGYTIKKGEPGHLGAKTALWADANKNGIVERDTFERLVRAVSVVSEKVWGGNNPDDSYDSFAFKFEKLYGGPNINIARDIKSESDRVLHYNFEEYDDKAIDLSGNNYDGIIKEAKIEANKLVFDGTSTLETGIDSLSYPYTVQFNINADLDVIDKTDGSILFDGYDGRLKLDQDGTLTVFRSYHTQSFKYKLPKDETVNLSIVGTNHVIKLYVNGEFEEAMLRERLDPNNYTELMSTFVFPLETVGKGFVGTIGNLSAYKKAMNPQEVLDSFEGVIQTKLNVSQNKGAAGHAQNPKEGSWDNADRKLRVAWKAIDGDGNTLDGRHGPAVSDKDSLFWGRLNNSHISLDFQEVRSVSEVNVQFDVAPNGGYELLTSTDGKNWTSVGKYSETNVKFDEVLETQYLRLVGSNFSLREIEVFETIDKTDLASALELLAKDNSKEAQALLRRAQSEYINTMSEQVIVDNFVTEVDEFINREEVEVDKSVLEALIESAKTKVESDYTSDSWSEFKLALTEAEALLVSEDITQAAVDKAVDSLQIALDNLVEVKAVDKSVLEKLVFIAGAKDEADYTAETWANFATKFSEAIKVLDNLKATQAEVDSAAESLFDAIEALEYATDEIDRIKLGELIKYAEILDLGEYTEATSKVVVDELVKAKSVLANESSTQADIEAAIKSLQAALDQLEAVSKEPEVPVDPEKPVKPGGGDQEKPPTGIANNPLIYVGVIAVLVVVVVLLKKRKE